MSCDYETKITATIKNVWMNLFSFFTEKNRETKIKSTKHSIWMNEWQNKKEREKDETIDSSIQMSFYYNFFLVKRRKRSSIVLFSFKNWYLMWGFIHKKMCKWSKRRQSTSRDKSMDVRIIIDCWNQILKCYKFSTLTKQKKTECK